MTEHDRPLARRQAFIVFISYVAVLQVLYALQTVLVSIPCVTIVSTFIIVILQRTKASKKPILIHAGSNVKSNGTHERDLQNLLIQQTEEVLQTNLQQFHRVSISMSIGSIDRSVRFFFSRR